MAISSWIIQLNKYIPEQYNFDKQTRFHYYKFSLVLNLNRQTVMISFFTQNSEKKSRPDNNFSTTVLNKWQYLKNTNFQPERVGSSDRIRIGSQKITKFRIGSDRIGKI